MTGSPYTVETLLAREEIHDVVKRLARGTDRLDAELIESCYHPDGFDDHNAFRGSGSDFAHWVLEVLSPFEATMHFIGSPLINVDGDVAQVDTYCVAHHLAHPDETGQQTDLILGLRYVDRFERRHNRWLIAKRVCAFDWSYTVETSHRMTFHEDWTVGSRDRGDVTYSGV